MRHGSLFSGIGGFDLAAEWMGWENVFHCEWMEFPRKVLEYHFPNADSHTDITKTDFKKYANTIDILTGGFPCQPFSMAGKRKGTDDERYLWHEMLRAIQEIKPQFVIAENVFGITNIDGGLVFEQVCLDLETEGYEVQPFIIPACSKNAPHRRDRCWFVAYSKSARTGKDIGWIRGEFDRCSKGLQKSRNATDTNGIRLEYTEKGRNIQGSTETTQRKGSEFAESIKANGSNGNVTDTNSQRCQWERKCGVIEKTGKNRNERFRELGNIKYQWEKFPTQSPICGGDDGLPTKLDGITFSKWRAESIKGYGNAIVPQVAYELFKKIELWKQYTNNTTI
jgi:DNA (cytosine-5)-methyltransferase 1